MVRAVLVVLSLGLLASCGADGAPTAPGLAVTGTAEVGIAKAGY